MGNAILGWMADEFRDYGLVVAEDPGWKTRTNYTANKYTPKGVANHHTAGSSILTNYPEPPFWSWSSLRTKCNVTIEPTGRVVCLNAGYAYDSGMGTPVLLDRVTSDQPWSSLTSTSSKPSFHIRLMVT